VREVDSRLGRPVIVCAHAPQLDQRAVLGHIEGELSVLGVVLERLKTVAREVLNLVDLDDQAGREQNEVRLRVPTGALARERPFVPAEPRVGYERSFAREPARAPARDLLQEEARRLHAEGLTCPQVAARLGVAFPTVKSWLWNTTEKKREYRLRLREAREAAAAGEAGAAVLRSAPGSAPGALSGHFRLG
jgi:hypothetical protein